MNRILLLSALLIAPAGLALAGDSIIDITSSRSGGGAVIEFRCATCAPENADNIEIHHGVKVTETQIGGETKKVQIDNMMGGSPVRTVRSAYPSDDRHSADGVAVFEPEADNIRRRIGGGAPIAANSTAQVTFSGGGDFNVEEVTPQTQGEQIVDPESQTSSVDMENAEHENVEGPEPSGAAPSRGGPEILDLRPGTTVGPQDQ